MVRSKIGKLAYDKIFDSYPESTQMILSDRYDEMVVKHPNVAKNLNSCVYNADDRSIETYARNVAISWVIEDFVIALTKSYIGVDLIKDGTDSYRQFLSHNNVSSDADFKVITSEGKEITIEFITDFYGYFTKQGKFYLRDNKLNNLLKKRKNRRVMILSIDIENRSFFLKDVRGLTYKPTTRYGKPSNEVLIDFDVHELNRDNFKEVFDKAM